MSEHKAPRNSSSGPPNPLDFPIKDPLRETYEGRWAQLPPIQKVGITVVLGFWCLFIATLVFSEGRAHYLNWLLPILVLATILGLPVALGIAWWSLLSHLSSIRQQVWHRRLLLSGKVAALCNLILSAAYLFYWSRFTQAPNLWKVRDACGTVGFLLAFWGLVAGEIAGNDSTRIALQVSFCLGVLFWIPYGIL